VAVFGKTGLFFYDIARGRDQRPVETRRIRKSIGTETTFAEDIVEFEQVLAIVSDLVHQVALLLEQKNTGGRTLSLKLRYNDFTTITRSCTSPRGYFAVTEMLSQLPRLLAATEVGRRKIRLLGVTVSNLFNEKERSLLRLRQLPLPFPPGRFCGDSPTSAMATQPVTR
jgi:DNA polymerase-4